MKDPLHGPRRMEGTEWLKKWTQPSGQQFGWTHFRDADQWNQRDKAPPMPSNSGKRLNYHFTHGVSPEVYQQMMSGGGSSSSTSNLAALDASSGEVNIHPFKSRGTDRLNPGPGPANTMTPQEIILQRSSSVPAGARGDAVQFPQRYNWKTNPWGTRNPCRQRGGISTWQPSHVEVSWGYPKGAEKWNKGTEKRRILHPAPTTGVLQGKIMV